MWNLFKRKEETVVKESVEEPVKDILSWESYSNERFLNIMTVMDNIRIVEEKHIEYNHDIKKYCEVSYNVVKFKRDLVEVMQEFYRNKNFNRKVIAVHLNTPGGEITVDYTL